MRLIIVGSLNGQIGAASKIAITRGAKVAHADDIEAALAALRSGQGADLVMADVRLDIKKLVDSLANERICVPVVACGIGNDQAAAVAAIRAGAKEYIPLPPDAELIAAVLEAVTEESSAIVYRDPAMAATLRIADQVAQSDATVLITGESGTGKELLARHIHLKSRRSGHKFISVNCAAIPETLLESELFGHEKGAFTGAIARRIGKFEEANGGTLLLDEITEMEPRLQAKLLRVIQERVVDRLGGGQPVKVDIRLIATTNRNLEEAVREGIFREDLFFRLNVINIRMPALRERPQDIDILADHFVARYSDMNGLPRRPIAAETRAKLRAHGWRGNVRELENTMHRAVLLAQSESIDPDAVVLSFNTGTSMSLDASPGTDHGTAAGAIPLVGRTVAEVERDLILNTLQHCLGNRTHAANILGISIRTLRNKLKLYAEAGVAVAPPREFDQVAMQG
ncbi:MAG: sigma-54 interaction domain-containing protein [Solirubrobacteraceae bacterium]